MFVLANAVIVPLLIKLETKFETIETISRTDISIMNKNFAFLTLTVILMPLTGQVTLSSFFSGAVNSFTG